MEKADEAAEVNDELSSSSSSTAAFLNDSEVWQDVEPSLQKRLCAWKEAYTTELCVFRIKDEATTRCLALLEVLLEKGERCSERCFRLTESAIACCDAHYTAWQLRREYVSLKCTPAVLEDELHFAKRWCTFSPKSYQAWHHRRWLVKQLVEQNSFNILEEELKSCESALESRDMKNMCVWAHRDAILRLMGKHNYCPAGLGGGSGDSYRGSTPSWPDSATGPLNRLGAEIEFADRLLSLDPLNNSAWVARNAAFARFRESGALTQLENADREALEKSLADWQLS